MSVSRMGLDQSVCISQVLNKSKEQRHRTLQTIAHHVRVWTVKVLKLKAVYTVMNKFLNEGQNYVAECWLPYGEFGSVQAVLHHGSVWLFCSTLSYPSSWTFKQSCNLEHFSS